MAKSAEKPSSIFGIRLTGKNPLGGSGLSSETIPPATGASLVLDTNATLDWMVFRDVGMGAAARAIERGQVAWLVCPGMRAEFARLLAHPRLAPWSPRADQALAIFDTFAGLHPDPCPLPQPRLRCTDADDQIFLDLALAQRCRWLLTHDRALLTLARRAAPLGLHIIRPADFMLD